MISTTDRPTAEPPMTEEIHRKFWKIRGGQELAAMRDIENARSHSDTKVKRYLDAMLPADKQTEAEDMGDIILADDITTNHYHGTQPGKEEPQTKPLPKTSTLSKALIAAALLTGGAGIGMGVNALLKQPTDHPTFTDTDNVTIGVPTVTD